MKHRPTVEAGWKEWADRIGTLVPRDRLHPAVLAWVAPRRKDEPWCVALSGGADSLALLLLLWAHWPERRSSLVALHFNHRLRGRESLAEERFCRRVGTALGIGMDIGRWPGRHRGASEAEARAARHGFFAREMERRRSRTLWLAHQQDDVAESMLMRLARGSGTAGLAAPRPVQPTGDGRFHVRPLLNLKKAELVAALQAVGADWCEDPSNRGREHFRNRVRLDVVPNWTAAAGRDALAGAALARERLEEDDAALEQWVDAVASFGPDRRLHLPAGQRVPRAVMRRVLHRWLLTLTERSDLSRQGFEILLAAVEAGRPTRFSLGDAGFAVIRRGQLLFEPA